MDEVLDFLLVAWFVVVLSLVVCFFLDFVKWVWRSTPAWVEAFRKWNASRKAQSAKVVEIYDQNQRILQALENQQREIGSITELLRYR